MRFDLTRPCADCPFRSDTPPFGLAPERVREILGGGEHNHGFPAVSFPCHKTIEYGGGFTVNADGRAIMCLRCGRTSYSQGDIENHYCGHCKIFHDDETFVGPNAQQCAGVMAILHRIDRPNDAMQLAERFGLWDPAKLDSTAPFYSSVEEAIAGQDR